MLIYLPIGKFQSFIFYSHALPMSKKSIFIHAGSANFIFSEHWKKILPNELRIWRVNRQKPTGVIKLRMRRARRMCQFKIIQKHLRFLKAKLEDRKIPQ